MSVEVAVMHGKYDIFLRLPDGQPVWIKAVESLQEARNQAAKIANETPGEYFIFDAKSGHRMPV